MSPVDYTHLTIECLDCENERLNGLRGVQSTTWCRVNLQARYLERA